ncbi:MAG: GNAT family N-acetyltransferase [Acidobacteriota bacterium]|nr:GNAT family N-acetyltransferase [Acidobacteriota bacterium]
MATLREAVAGDESAVALVHVRSWQAGYRGLIADDRLDALDPAQRAQRYRFADRDPRAPRTILAVEGRRIVGFATWGHSRVDGQTGAEVLGLYVDPDHWGRGVGSLLRDAVITALRQWPIASAHLWVLEGNRRAQRFYFQRGWRLDGASRRATVWGARVSLWRLSRRLEDEPRDR